MSAWRKDDPNLHRIVCRGGPLDGHTMWQRYRPDLEPSPLYNPSRWDGHYEWRDHGFRWTTGKRPAEGVTYIMIGDDDED